MVIGGFRGGGGFHHGRGYGRGHYYRHGYGYGYGGLIYAYGFPYCYPYDGSPYYGAPAYADYGDEPDDGYAVPPAYPYNAPVVTSGDDSSQTATYTAQDVQGYYQVGDQWGAGMKQYKLTMSQLITYLQSYIVDSSPAQQDAFRSGSIASAIPNARRRLTKRCNRPFRRTDCYGSAETNMGLMPWMAWARECPGRVLRLEVTTAPRSLLPS